VSTPPDLRGIEGARAESYTGTEFARELYAVARKGALRLPEGDAYQQVAERLAVDLGQMLGRDRLRPLP
jgi:hypothetical protein